MFIKKSEIEFAIIIMYINDLNLIEIPKDHIRATNYL